MKLRFTARARKDYLALPERVQKTADKQLDLLLNDLRHPSLRSKKYDERRDIWQGRITRDWRFYFQITGDACLILAITKHPK